MKLTTKSEYALLALIYIAREAKGAGYVKVEDICQRYGVSKKYLEHILSSLKQNRYISTRRGAGGGYRLARPAGKISAAEIIRLMDGALAPTLAVSKYFYSSTPIEKEGKLLSFFGDIREFIAKKVEKMSIADFV